MHQLGINRNIAATCIDTGGHYTDEVYKFCNKYQRSIRVFAIKGASQVGKQLVSKSSSNNRFGVKLFMVGTDTAKETIYSRLKIEEQGPGYCHFPSHYDDEFFKQLTAEKFMIKYEKGRTKMEWRKIRKRNEALDCRVYNLAAYEILKPNIFKIEENLLRNSEAYQGNDNSRDNTKQMEPAIHVNHSTTKQRRTKKRPSRSSSYVNGWKNM